VSRFKTGTLLVLLSGVCFGFVPVLGLYAYQGGATVLTLLFLRFTFAACIFFTYLFARSIKLRLTRAIVFPLLLIGGLFHPLQSYLYLASLKYISAGLAVLLFYTYPVWVAIWSFLFHKERLSVQTACAIALAFAGLSLVVGTSLDTVNSIGVILALGSAFFISIYIISSGKILQQMDSIVVSAFLTLLNSVFFFVVGSATGTLNFHLEPLGWLATIASAIIATNIALFAFLAGLERVGSTTASILCMTEPVTTAIFSALLLSQRLTLLQWFGGLVILLGAALVVVAKGKHKEGQVTSPAP